MPCGGDACIPVDATIDEDDDLDGTLVYTLNGVPFTAELEVAHGGNNDLDVQLKIPLTGLTQNTVVILAPYPSLLPPTLEPPADHTWPILLIAILVDNNCQIYFDPLFMTSSQVLNGKGSTLSLSVISSDWAWPALVKWTMMTSPTPLVPMYFIRSSVDDMG